MAEPIHPKPEPDLQPEAEIHFDERRLTFVVTFNDWSRERKTFVGEYIIDVPDGAWLDVKRALVRSEVGLYDIILVGEWPSILRALYRRAKRKHALDRYLAKS